MALVDTPVTFKLPQGLIDAGGIELYAEYHGWTSQVQDPADETQTISNPVTALEYAVKHIGNWLERDFAEAYIATKLSVDKITRKQEATDLLQELIDYKASLN